jgi:hypothetical protein
MIEIISNKKEGSGFDVLHTFCTWKLAFISYAEQYGELKLLKRHTETDEAFLLINGSGVIFSSEDGENPQKTVLQKEKLYVVKKGTWHHLQVSSDALLLAVENSDTSKENTETLIITEKETHEVNK